MKFKKTKAAALTLAAVLACGTLAGCDLVTTNTKRDLEQTIIEVNIANSADFQGSGKYAAYASSIGKSEILKRDIVANYASYGATYLNYGYSAEDVYELIRDSLVNRQIFMQYAKVYFFETGEYTVDGYNKAVSDASEADKPIAGYRYFLTADEIAKTEYDLRVSLNSTIDSQEQEVIEGRDHDHNHEHTDTTAETSSRTTPTGVDTEAEDYFDPAYKVYTGFGAETDVSSPSASACGSYETLDESTPSTRNEAYKNFLASLNAYGLISKGENTSDLMSLSYYALQRKTQYETALVNKLTEAFEKEAEKTVTKDWIEGRYAATLSSQREQFRDASAVESALDSVSDSSFVFYAPDNYGFVINILLPFSTSQSQKLSDNPADSGDKKGNKFVTRASLLKDLTATDQRSAWFDADYSFEAEEADGAFTGGSADRKYLFFENSLKHSVAEEGASAQYESLKNYYGKYTYNGSVKYKEDEDGEKTYSFNPNKLSIDGFLTEMENYLNSAGLHLTKSLLSGPEYFSRPVNAYYKNNNVSEAVDYSKFLYFKAKIDELADYDANEIFLKGSEENTAFSVINELSFAYNTDTAGLNSHLGYAVSPNNTDFVKEFEYAAQEAVRGGAGTITVAPSDYGWHIMYCTFSYAGNDTPYTFRWEDVEEEGTFSNLYYEALKAENFTTFSTNRRTSIINSYDSEECVYVYQNRYDAIVNA